MPLYGKFYMDKWDGRYLRLAKEVASWSKDPSTKVGAVAVLNGMVLAQGYNGFPRGIKDSEEKYLDRETKYQYVVHAEMNCIFNAAMNGVSLYGSTLYIYPLPACHECAKGIIQCGVERVVSPVFENEFTQRRWEKSCSTTFNMFEEAGIEYDLIKGFTNV
jgi:dCMP deaminase